MYNPAQPCRAARPCASRALAGALLLAALATTARADFVNGGFEAGDLTGFTSIGTAAAVTDSVGVTPAAGTFQALLQTGQTAAGDPIGAAEADLAAFLGVTTTDLDAMNGPVGDGSAIAQTTAVALGDVVSFDFRFLTTESVSPPDVDFLDFAFVAIDGAIVKLADLTSGFTAAPAASGYTSITFGPGSVAIAGLSAGSHTFGFGVVDVGDVSFVAIGDSGLILDALRVSGNAVPEPSGLALLAVGLLGLSGYLARRRVLAVA